MSLDTKLPAAEQKYQSELRRFRELYNTGSRSSARTLAKELYEKYGRRAGEDEPLILTSIRIGGF
jgi:hypothetical protein